MGSISQSKKTKTIVRWFMRTGRLEMYRLAIRLIDKWEIEEEEGELIGTRYHAGVRVLVQGRRPTVFPMHRIFDRHGMP